MSVPRDLVRTYYAALDEHAYEELSELLAPEFVHYRPDRTIEGRETFVEFMRDERPMKNTTHEIERAFPAEDGTGVAVQGRLLDGEGDQLFRFADVHAIEDGRIRRLRTYTQ